MEIIITDNYDLMSEEAFKLVKNLVRSNPNSVLGLATGSTPLGLYKLMSDDYNYNGTSYKNIKTVNLDEYVGLGKDNVQSYAYFMNKYLFKNIDINLNNTYIENGLAIDKEKECKRYNNLLNELKQDIQILGIGSNGHIAFNEPFTSFDSVVHVVKLAESTIKDNSRLFNSIDEVPRYAFTMGLKNIMNAKKIIIMASGVNKAKAVYELVHGKITEEVPCTILRNHKDCILICDKEAGSLL